MDPPTGEVVEAGVAGMGGALPAQSEPADAEIQVPDYTPELAQTPEQLPEVFISLSPATTSPVPSAQPPQPGPQQPGTHPIAPPGSPRRTYVRWTPELHEMVVAGVTRVGGLDNAISLLRRRLNEEADRQLAIAQALLEQKQVVQKQLRNQLEMQRQLQNRIRENNAHLQRLIDEVKSSSSTSDPDAQSVQTTVDPIGSLNDSVANVSISASPNTAETSSATQRED